ncbi:MAG: ABC transporter substrate-binding protein [Dehalococcoidia bacterium]
MRSCLCPRRDRKLIGLFFLIVLVLVVAACGGEDEEDLDLWDISRSPDTPIIIPAGEPIVVGVSTALTGPIGVRGGEYRDAVVAGVERWKAENGSLIKGHEIEVQAEDDGCTETDVTRGAAEQLLGREGLVGVIGPQCSGGSAAVIPIYADAGIVAISGSATRTDLTLTQPEGGFFFRTAYRNDLEGALIASYLVSTHNAQTVYLVFYLDPFGKDLSYIIQ